MRAIRMRSLLWLLFVFITALPSYAKLKMTFDPDTVVASGVTPGAKTVWMDVSVGSAGYRTRITDHTSVVIDEDGDGVVRLSVNRVPSVSIWAVVDMSSGDYAVDSPAPGHFPHQPLPAAALHRKGNTASAELQSDLTTAVFWYVRPGHGAWKSIVDDGEPSDADGKGNGKLNAATARMQACDGDDTPPPDDLQAGDVVFIVDLFGLTATDARVSD
jgi:hypothetical protein